MLIHLLTKPRRFRARGLVSASAPFPVVLSAAVSMLLPACTGAISGELAPGGNAVGGNGSAVGGAGGNSNIPLPPVSFPAEKACTSNSAGPTMLRRLSAAQFTASIVDLFHDPTAPVAAVFNDPLVMGFGIDANSLLVAGLNADQLMTNAEAVAAWAVTNHLADVTGCDSSDAACPDAFIRSFGKRAFRAPLSDASVAAYRALFAAEATFGDGVGAVVAAMLQSPRFLYRTELGAPPTAAPAAGAPVALTPYEVASSLSYLLTGSTPDAPLLAAADAVAGGSLAMGDMVEQQGQRLLADPRSQDTLMDFMNSWLGLDKLYSTVKDDSVFMLSNSLRDDMAAETRGLILDTFVNGGSFSDLLTADHSFLNKDLADYYGFDSTGLGSAFTKVAYPSPPGPGAAARDGGLLAHAGILTGYARADISSPTQRGHLVRTRLLCQYVSPPGQTLDTTFKPDPHPTTTRAHYENAARARELRRVSPGDGSDRIRLRALRRLRPLAQHRERLPDRFDRHDLPGQRHRRRRRLRRRARAGDLPGRQRRSQELHGAQLVVLRLRQRHLDPGRLHLRGDSPGGHERRLYAAGHAAGDHPRAALHQPRAGAMSSKARRT